MEVNYLAVLVATVVAFAIGALWYGPLFGKPWMKLMGYTKKDMEKMKKKGMMMSYALGFLRWLVLCLILSHLLVIIMTGKLGIGMVEVWGIGPALATGFFLWLGFVGTVTLSDVLWGGRSWKLWALNNGYNLLAILVMTGILTVWV